MVKEIKSMIRYNKTLPYIEERESYQIPTSHLEKDGENSYRIVEGRRASERILINNLRKAVDAWREADYPSVSSTTRILLDYWFNEDHLLKDERFNFWFCQREAIETLVYLHEVRKYSDLIPVIEEYAEKSSRDLFNEANEFSESMEGIRKLIRYDESSDRMGERELPPLNLLRYAFKMATGAGKTLAMAMIIVWSYFHKKKEKNSLLSDNFLLLTPNIIVYERLEKDFASKIFREYPLVPPQWMPEWNLKITLREDSSPLASHGNLIVNNIQQLYESRKELPPTMDDIMGVILGPKPQKDLTKPAVTLLEQIVKLDDVIIINDEAYHVHSPDLEWHKTLMRIHSSLPKGINLWLDFSATPKTQTGTYYPWIIVDYPLAQAVEDRIVKAPLIVKQINKKDPEVVTKDNVFRKYSTWIEAAIVRWKEHYKLYIKVGKKPVLFIMAEKNEHADRIADSIRKDKRLGLK